MSAACPELGFDVVLELARDVDDVRRRELREEFLTLVESRGLLAAGRGGGGGVLRYRITRDGGQAIDADREAFEAWARRRPQIASFTVGPLLDLRDTTG